MLEENETGILSLLSLWTVSKGEKTASRNQDSPPPPSPGWSYVNIGGGFPGGSLVQNPPANAEVQEILKGKGAAEVEMVR